MRILLWGEMENGKTRQERSERQRDGGHARLQSLPPAYTSRWVQIFRRFRPDCSISPPEVKRKKALSRALLTLNVSQLPSMPEPGEGYKKALPRVFLSLSHIYRAFRSVIRGSETL